MTHMSGRPQGWPDPGSRRFLDPGNRSQTPSTCYCAHSRSRLVGETSLSSVHRKRAYSESLLLERVPFVCQRIVKYNNQMAKRVAVVTGANKGLGFGIVRALCKQFDGDVYLTSRDESRGKSAVQELEKEGLQPKFHQLDLNNHDSIVKMRDFLQNQYQGLDVLVNNAGIAYKMDSTAPFSEQAEVTTKTNFFDTLAVCEVLFPILRPHARVVNVSSMMSRFALAKCSDKLQARFTDREITMEELTSLMKQFVQAARNNTAKQDGFPDTTYGMSKIGVTVMSIIQQRELDKQGKQDIVVNACCPGYVDTDMTSHKGSKTIDEGAETPVYLALLPPNVQSPRGNFVQENKVFDWKI